MKSLFIINDFPPILGGQSTYYYNLCRGLPADKIVVLAPSRKGSKEFDDNVAFQVIRKLYVFNIPIVEKFLKIILPLIYVLPILKRENIKIIHCAHVLSTGVIGLLLKKIKKIPYVVYTHSADMLTCQKYPLIKKLLIAVLLNANYVMCNSRFTKNIALELGVPEEKIIILYPRIDFDKYDINLDIEKIIEKFNLKDKKIILSVNRLVERKGNDVVIKAMPLISKQVNNAVYVVVGNGPYKETLMKLTDDLNLKKQVVFTSSLSNEEMIGLYKTCNVFVMASRELKETGNTEGFGIVFLEANACGKPVIGGNSGGIPDAVIHGKTGLLVEPESLEDVANSIIKILQDEGFSRSLGEFGKKRAREDFDWKNGIKELEHLFN